jgi:CysZ protein
MQSLIQGVGYNLRGIWLGIRTPKLLWLGTLRFLAMILLTVAAATMVFAYHGPILDMLWNRPQSHWVLWLWHVVSWLLSLLLAGLSAIVAYLVGQLLFAVVIMDQMSKITQRIVTGRPPIDGKRSFFSQFGHLVSQEIPRSTIPILITLILMVLGWLTPAGPVLAMITSVVAIVFLAWDHTDLVPARQMQPFGQRFRFLMATLLFHVGFGLLFLVPLFNVVALSFAPVGGTLYHLERDG